MVSILDRDIIEKEAPTLSAPAPRERNSKNGKVASRAVEKGSGGEVARGTAQMRIVTARSAEELQPHVGAWDDLAASAVEPNVFYDSWMLLPALQAFG